MNQNPLSDIATRTQQQRLTDMHEDISEIKSDVRSIMENVKLIDFEIMQDGIAMHTLINPRYITFVESSGETSHIHMSDGTVLYVKSTQSEILDKISGAKYIK